MLSGQGRAHEERQAVPARDVVSRNAHGESLEDAREAFRAEWEAKLRKKKQAAAQARQKVERIAKTREAMLPGGLLLSACFGVLIGVLVMGFPGFAAGFLLGGLFGINIVIPPLLLCRGGEWFYRQRAERLEHEIREMERG